MFRHIPIKIPRPDATEFLDIVLGRKPARRVPLVEYIVDPVVMKPIITKVLGRKWAPYGPDRILYEAHLDNIIAFWHLLGYDCVRIEFGLPFPEKHVVGNDPTREEGERSWTDQHTGSITSWEDFEQYPWPDVHGADLWPLKYINDHLPEGMGLLSCHGGGVFEHLSQIMSIEGLCTAVYEQPGLVQAVADRVGETLLAYHRRLLDLNRLIAIFQGDDMGFRTGTLITPDQMRQYSLPWHKKFAEQAHGQGRPYLLHSCGNLATIMEDLIADVGIDAKHSFEDAIIPVEDFHAAHGNRIGVLGGVDVNILSAGSPESVRKRTRFLIETCGSRGRYAIGSGNSIPSYIPVANYLAMVDEANLLTQSSA